MSRRIALYGGSFNPPHQGHLDVIKWLANDCPQDLNEVWVLPTVNHAFAKELADYEVREELVTAMIDDAFKGGYYPPIRDSIKVVRREEVYTAELLDNLEAENPGDEFVPVIGADIINAAGDWHRWGDVVARKPIVVARKGVECKTDLKVHEVDAAEVSSTSVRERLANGDLTYLIGKGADLPERVMSIIERKNLYGWPKLEYHKHTSTVDRVNLPISKFTEAFKPGQNFCVTGDITQILGVHAENVEIDGELVYCVVITVVRNPAVSNKVRGETRRWHEKKTEARRDGTEFTATMPVAVSPDICYLNYGEAVDGEVGEFIGKADELYFFKGNVVGFNGLFKGLFGL